MFTEAVARAHAAFSVLFGTPFDPGTLERQAVALRQRQTDSRYGRPEAVGRPRGPALDEATSHQAQLRRFRAQAQRAADETTYYRRLFARSGLDPARLTFEEITRIPPTTREAVCERPDDFTRSKACPSLRVVTTGASGAATSIAFSRDELRSYVALGAISLLSRGIVGSADLVQISTSSGAVLGNACFAGACERAGALVHQAGLVSAEHTLALLTRQQSIAGRWDRVTVLSTYPSHLGEVVEHGQRLGLGPADFRLRTIFAGGELVTAGLKSRARRLFGEIQFVEGYGMAETWPVAGVPCAEEHLHFEPSQALVEVLDLESGRPARPGRAGTIVATPFAPYRQTTLLLRYDTRDVVRALDAAPSCALKHLPATGPVLGKLDLSVQHDEGWTFPRQVIEALEALDAVPLPARFGFWMVPGGMAVEVVTRHGDEPAARRAIERALGARGAPVRELRLMADPRELQRPFPRRADRRDATLGQPPAWHTSGVDMPSATVLRLATAS
jgi:phenylacetate-coenzyme A ligase PaaK-like adenylate-forming protein